MKKFDQSREIALFVDKLRAYRNISQEDFLFEIISMRQYRRYMNGDSTLSYVVLDKLARRLGFTAEFVIMEIEAEKIKQSQLINEFYNTVITKNIEKSRMLLLEIDERHLIDDNNLLLFHHAKNLFDFHSGINSKRVTLNKTKKLIDLENALQKRALSTSELLILVSFFHFDEYKEINLIAERLSAYMKNNITVVSGHNIKVLTFVLEELSRYYSIIGDYDKTLYYAKEGIKYAIRLRSFYLLDSLYYFAAAASHELNQIENRNDYLFKCISLLFMVGTEEKISKFKALFKKRFDVDMQLFVDKILESK